MNPTSRRSFIAKATTAIAALFTTRLSATLQPSEVVLPMPPVAPPIYDRDVIAKAVRPKVRVKRLEWVQQSHNPGFYYAATSLADRFEIYLSCIRAGQWVMQGPGAPYKSDNSYYSTLQSAQDAAQEHWERVALGGDRGGGCGASI